MGCCGHDFGSIKEVKEAVIRNTSEFRKFDDLRKFRDRADKWNLRKGVCRNVIMVKGQVFCPLHPERNKGKDLRKGHCETGYLCKTARIFSGWRKKKQQNFLEFIKKKNLGVIEYSIKMDDGSLLKEFLNQKN